MKWSKIIIIGAAVILLFSGISIAGYIHLYPPVFNLYPPVFKIEFSQSTSFFDSYQLNAERLIKSDFSQPASAKIEEIARLAKITGKCI